MTATPPTQAELLRKMQKDKEFVAARNTYLLIILTFVSICVVAVVVTNDQESHKTGFRAIETSQPMWFFDKTYYQPEASPPSDAAH